MVKLALLLCAAAAVAALVALVPVHGRTLLDRWERANGVGDFVERGWREVRAAALPGAAGHVESHPPRPARPRRSDGAGAKGPTERHTDADRAALDRLVTDRAR